MFHNLREERGKKEQHTAENKTDIKRRKVRWESSNGTAERTNEVRITPRVTFQSPLAGPGRRLQPVPWKAVAAWSRRPTRGLTEVHNRRCSRETRLTFGPSFSAGSPFLVASEKKQTKISSFHSVPTFRKD